MRDEDRINETKAYYENRAPWHDIYMSYSGNEQMEHLLKPIVEVIIPFIANRSVLEIACGTGNWTEVVAKRASSVLAIDSSPGALNIARKKLEKFKNVTFAEMDAYNLEGINGHFDLAFAADWWSHMPKSSVKPFLENLHKKLASGSRVIFIDMMLRDVFENEEAYYDEDGNRISLRILPDGGEYKVIKNFPSGEELAAFFKDFTDDFSYREFESLKRWMLSYAVGSL